MIDPETMELIERDENGNVINGSSGSSGNNRNDGGGEYEEDDDNNVNTESSPHGAYFFVA